MGSKYEGLTDVERLDKYRETLAKLEADGADKRVVGQWKSRVAKLEAEIGVVEVEGTEEETPEAKCTCTAGVVPGTASTTPCDLHDEPDEGREPYGGVPTPDEDEESLEDPTEGQDDIEDITEQEPIDPVFPKVAVDGFAQGYETKVELTSSDPTPTEEPQPVGNRYPIEDQPTERDMRPTLHKTGTYELTDRGLVSACPHCEAKQVPFGDTGKSSPLSAGNFSRAEVACGVCNKVYVLLPDTSKEQVVNLTGEMERQTGQTEAVQDAARAMGGGQHKEQERREEQATKPKRVKKPAKVGTPCCMCGCGAENKPGSRFKMGHDARVKAALSKVKRGDQDPNTIHPYTIKMFQQYPEIVVAGYGRDEVMKLAGIEG